MNNKFQKPISGNALLLIGLLLTLAVVLAAFQTARAASILYAAPTAQGSGDCSSWANACPLQTALTGAASGDEIWAKAGVHYPGSNRTDTFALQSGVVVYGGFAGTETAREERNWETHITVLSGDIDKNDLTDPTGVVTTTAGIVGANSYHVVMGGTGSSASLDGFTITAGKADGINALGVGGGLDNLYGSPILTNLIFSGNYAANDGGGVHNYYGAPVLANVVFQDNQASYGGGMFNAGSPQLLDVAFMGNQGETCGGGLFNSWSSPALTNAIFRENIANSGAGGGICNWHSDPTLINVLFHDNTAVSDYGGMGGGGGGMWNGYSNPTLINVTLASNIAYDQGGGLYNYGESFPTVHNSILWGNFPDEILFDASSGITLDYSLVQGGCPAGGSCSQLLDNDPAFVDSAGGDLRLLPGSWAIDAGDNTQVTVDTDLAGGPRLVDIPGKPDAGLGDAPIVDLGAYEANFVDMAVSIMVETPASAQAAPGEEIVFRLAFSNGGSIKATQVVITDDFAEFPGTTSYVSYGVPVTETSPLLPYVWTTPSLGPGEGGVIDITGIFTVPLAAGIYNNTAMISADQDAGAANNTMGLTFEVLDVAPVFTNQPVLIATQDDPYAYSIAAEDLNGDLLEITAPTLPAWLTLEDHGDGTGTLSGTPAPFDVGDHPIVLQVADGGGLTGTQTFTITVANVNDAPFFTSSPVLAGTQDAPYAYAISADDPDLNYGDALTITAPTLPAWLTLEDHGDGTATLAGTPGDNDVGEHLVLLRVTDSAGAPAEQEFAIIVAERSYYVYLPLVFSNWRP
jgi:uncharacterized repeat protein (TIGR01451 family)